jgi:hypothetical protein
MFYLPFLALIWAMADTLKLSSAVASRTVLFLPNFDFPSGHGGSASEFDCAPEGTEC